MLDIKLLRTETEKVKAALARRKEEVDIDAILELDTKKRETLFEVEQLKSKQNEVSKKIPAMKKAGEDVAPVFAEMKELSDNIKQLDEKVRSLDEEINTRMLTIPNLPNPEVPDGMTDDDNVEVRRFMEPKEFNFEPKAHWDIGADLGILDAPTAGKVTGTRFTFYRGLGARLERAIINFYLDTHTTDSGYTEIFPPYMVHKRSTVGTGQLPKFEEDAFKVACTDYFLIPTAEVPVTNMYRDEILDGTKLPIKHVAYSACFRAEAGSAGRDTRGLIRQHQFNKVELVTFAHPDHSYEELDTLTKDAANVLQLLGLPYRVVCLSSGDIGFSSAKTYDIEVWMPSYGRYVEISSCSNFEDYQARRANIRFKGDAKDKARYVHTLNGSGVAIGRTVAAIMENFQRDDGGIDVPEALRKYMGTDIIK